MATLFTLDGDTAVPGEHARGPWDPRSCHGGPVGALLVRAVERVEEDTTRWQIARVTVELLRPVPVLEPLTVAARIERPGRMVSLVAASLSTGAGEVARAVALRVRREPVETPGFVREAPFTPAGDGAHQESTWSLEGITFNNSAVELRFADGSWQEHGPVALWGRLTVDVVEGEEPSGAQRAIALADFANGVSSELDPDQAMFINPDLTLHLSRPPVGEWVGIRSRSHYGDEGAGFSETAVYDERGRVGTSAQSLLLAPRVRE